VTADGEDGGQAIIELSHYMGPSLP
jgi:hypothetical protein